jgi:drug/metabolite transporter (DMT)-like permease
MTDVGRRTAEERSIGELFGALSQDMALLVRQEGQLAKTEMQQKLTQVTGDLVSLASGGIVALVGGLALTAAVILLLIDPVGLKPWLAALIVGVLMGVIGWMMLQKGLKQLKRTDPTPRRTVDTIKDDIQWAKEQRP